jgi:hypothetical protein
MRRIQHEETDLKKKIETNYLGMQGVEDSRRPRIAS